MLHPKVFQTYYITKENGIKVSWESRWRSLPLKTTKGEIDDLNIIEGWWFCLCLVAEQSEAHPRNCQEFIITQHLCTWRPHCMTLHFFIPQVWSHVSAYKKHRLGPWSILKHALSTCTGYQRLNLKATEHSRMSEYFHLSLIKLFLNI